MQFNAGLLLDYDKFRKYSHTNICVLIHTYTHSHKTHIRSHLCVWVASKLFCAAANLSWMEESFLNHSPCMRSWPGVFQFGTFRVLIWANQGLRAVFEFLQIFHVVYPFDFSVVPYFASKLFVSLTFDCGYVFVLAGRIFFRCFRMTSLVYVVWFYLGIFIIFLLSPVPYDLSSCLF